MAKHLPLLIIGAGPYGLTMAAYAQHKNIEYRAIGKTMDFWRSNMPKGMVLRSACDWHYDPFNQDTFERYLETQNLKPVDVEPLALDSYLSYVDWFVNGSARARAELDCMLDVRFGPTRDETLDIFPARKGDGSVLVFIHGGYWRSLDKKDFSFLAPASWYSQPGVWAC